MKTKKKSLQDDNTQLLSSDQNQVESVSDHRPLLRDAALVAAGVAAGVAGSAFVHAQTSTEAVNATSENIVSATTNESTNQNAAATNTVIPAVSSPTTDAVHEDAKPEASPAPEEIVLTTANGANVAHVDNSLTFGEAFADARNQVGPGGVFSYNGQLYNTYYREEWNNLTSDQKNEYYASVSLPENSHSESIAPNVATEPVHETSFSQANSGAQPQRDEVYVLGVGSSTIEGQEVYVAHLSTGGEDVVLLDIDKNGIFELAVADVNSDGEISQDEIFDISDRQITVAQMQEALHSKPDVFEPDTNMNDYTNNADISHFA